MKAIKQKTHISNVLVIGSGGAGLRAAIEAKLAGVEVTIIAVSYTHLTLPTKRIV